MKKFKTIVRTLILCAECLYAIACSIFVWIGLAAGAAFTKDKQRIGIAWRWERSMVSGIIALFEYNITNCSKTLEKFKCYMTSADECLSIY